MTRTAASQSMPVIPIFLGSGGGAPVGRRWRRCTSGTTTTRSAGPAALGGLFMEGPPMRRSDAHQSLHVRLIPSDGRMTQRCAATPTSLAAVVRSKRRSKWLPESAFRTNAGVGAPPEAPSERLPNRTPCSRAFTLGRAFRTRPGSMSRFAPKRNQSQTNAVTVGHETGRRAGAYEPASERWLATDASAESRPLADLIKG